MSDEEFIPLYEESEWQNYQTYESKVPVNVEQETDKMTSKKTRVVATKEKELEFVVTPLVKFQENIKKSKVQETSWAQI